MKRVAQRAFTPSPASGRGSSSAARKPDHTRQNHAMSVPKNPARPRSPIRAITTRRCCSRSARGSACGNRHRRCAALHRPRRWRGTVVARRAASRWRRPPRSRCQRHPNQSNQIAEALPQLAQRHALRRCRSGAFTHRHRPVARVGDTVAVAFGLPPFAGSDDATCIDTLGSPSTRTVRMPTCCVSKRRRRRNPATTC